MANQFWIKRDGKVGGPFAASQLKKFATAGKLQRDDQISANQTSWTAARNVEGLSFPEQNDDLAELALAVLNESPVHAARPDPASNDSRDDDYGLDGSVKEANPKPCSNCGVELACDAVLCVDCGTNQQTGERHVRQVESSANEPDRENWVRTSTNSLMREFGFRSIPPWLATVLAPFEAAREAWRNVCAIAIVVLIPPLILAMLKAGMLSNILDSIFGE